MQPRLSAGNRTRTNRWLDHWLTRTRDARKCDEYWWRTQSTSNLSQHQIPCQQGNKQRNHPSMGVLIANCVVNPIVCDGNSLRAKQGFSIAVTGNALEAIRQGTGTIRGALKRAQKPPFVAGTNSYLDFSMPYGAAFKNSFLTAFSGVSDPSAS